MDGQSSAAGLNPAFFLDIESQGALLADALASGDQSYIARAQEVIERAREIWESSSSQTDEYQ